MELRTVKSWTGCVNAEALAFGPPWPCYSIAELCTARQSREAIAKLM